MKVKYIPLFVGYLIVACNLQAQDCGPTVAFNFDSNTTDLTGNGNNAVLFSGASTASNYLEIGYNATDRAEIPAAALNGVSDFTITLEFYLNSLNLSGAAPTNTIIAGASAFDESEFAISYQADIEAIVVALKGSGDIFPISLSAGNWYCLTVLRDGSDVTVSIDGVEVTTIDMTSTPLSIQFLEMGQELDCVGGCYATNQSLNGRIDNFKIYPCSDPNVSCQPYIVACDTLLNYKFNGNVLDDGTFGNNGTINAGATVASNILEIGYNNDDYINIPVAAADGLVDFAISFNFYLNELNINGSSPTNTFIAGTDGINMGEFALSYEASSNAFEIAIHEVGGIIPASISANEWYCVTFYRSYDSVWIELDGVMLPTVISLPVGPISLVFLEIGQEIDCVDGCFAENQSLNGKMDNLIIQGCAEQIACSEPSVGIETIINSDIGVYPNPVSDFIYVELPKSLSVDNISIMSSTGQIVKTITKPISSSVYEIDMTNELPGVYFLQFKNEEAFWSKQIVVVR